MNASSLLFAFLFPLALPFPASRAGELKPVLGAAYFSEQESLSGGSCLENTRIARAGEAHSSFSLENSLSETELQSELGFEAGARASYGLADFSLSAGFVRNSLGTGLAVTSAWESDYLFPSDSLSVTLDDLNATGKAVLKDGHWNRTCGDRFIKELTRGARLFFSVSIDFKSQEEKSAFQAKFSISGPLAGVSASLKEASRSLSRSTRVTVRGYQIGGDVSRLTRVFPQSPEGRTGFIQCQLGELEKCAAALESAIEYATDSEKGFPSQLGPEAKPGPAILGYKTAPYTAIGIFPDDYPEIDQATRLARKEVSDAFRTQFRHAVTVDRILAGKIPADRGMKLRNLRGLIDQNLSLLLGLAKTCYESPKSCWSSVHPAGGGNLALAPVDETLFQPPPFSSLCTDPDPVVKNSLRRLAAAAGHPGEPCKTLEDRLVGVKKIEIRGTGSIEDAFDARVLSSLTGLEHLALTGSRLTDASPVGDLEAIRTLDLSDNHLESVEALGSLPDLVSLNLGLNRIRSLSGLDALNRLETLALFQNGLTSLAPLGHPPALQRIDLRQNRLAPGDIADFKKHYPSTLTVLE